MKVLVTDSYYNLLVYLVAVENAIFETFFITGKHLKKNSLKYVEGYSLDNGQFSKSSYFLDFFKINRLLKKKKISLDKIYGQDHHLLGQYFLSKSKEFILIEDGLGNYYPPMISKKMKFLMKILKTKGFLGRDKRVKKILLTGQKQIPKDLGSKVELIKLKEKWEIKKSIEKKAILNCFVNLPSMEKLKNRKIILFTQWISEEGYCTENEKIDIYRKCLKKYDLSDVIIKTHPREKTNYKKYFPEALVLEKPFPFEILDLINIKFDVAITLFSSSVYIFDEKTKIEWWGTSVHKNIEKKFGKIELKKDD